MFRFLSSDFRNRLISKLIEETHLYCGTVYEVCWRVNHDTLLTCMQQVKEAREKSGCFSKKDYEKWWETSEERVEFLKGVAELFSKSIDEAMAEEDDE